MNLIYERFHTNPRTIVFAEGEEDVVIRSAKQWVDSNYGKAILVGRERKVQEACKRLGLDDMEGISITNAAISDKNDDYINYLYPLLQRTKGFLRRDCVRMVKNDRNVFASCILGSGEADILITGVTRSYNASLKDIMPIIQSEKGKRVFALSMLMTRDKRTVFLGDTSIHTEPNAEELATIAEQAAEKVAQLGYTPRVAMVSYSNFGNPTHDTTRVVRDAVKVLESRNVSFEFDGDIAVDVAITPELLAKYPFSRLKKPANILIMPNLQAANITSKTLEVLSGGTMVGPILCGMSKPVQIIGNMKPSVSDLLNLAAVGGVDTLEDHEKVAKIKRKSA